MLCVWFGECSALACTVGLCRVRHPLPYFCCMRCVCTRTAVDPLHVKMAHPLGEVCQAVSTVSRQVVSLGRTGLCCGLGIICLHVCCMCMSVMVMGEWPEQPCQPVFQSLHCNGGSQQDSLLGQPARRWLNPI